jgi:hypothetical protein
MKTIKKIVVSCECLGLEENFQGFCIGHVFDKTCQYVTTNEKMCRNLSMFLLNLFNQICKKCITWLKKFRKGKQEWNKVCEDFNICPRNKTL